MRQPLHYSFPPPEHRHVLGSLTAGQLVSMAVTAMAALFGIVQPDPRPARIGAALLVLVMVAGVVCTPVRGRVMTGWLPVVTSHLLGRAAGRGDWRAASSAPRADAPTRVGVLGLPPELGEVTFLAYPHGGGMVGVAAERRAGRYTGVLEVNPPSFLLEEPSAQEEQLARWGALLARLAQPGSELDRLQWIVQRAPDEGSGLRRYFEQVRARDLPEAAAAIRSYLDLLAGVSGSSDDGGGGGATASYRTLLAVQVSARTSARAIRRAGGGDRGACAVLSQALEMVTAGLGNLGAGGQHPLGVREYQGLLRLAADPAAQPILDALAAARPERGWGSDAPWPVATETRWGYYRTADHAWHRSFAVVLPMTEVGADWLVPLLVEGTACRTVAVTLRSVPRQQATRDAGRALTRLHAEEQRKRRLGQLAAATDAKAETAAHRRLRELADGHADVVYAATVTVTAAGLDQLEVACREVEHLAALAGCELRALDGQQALGFTWTLPLARGLG